MSYWYISASEFPEESSLKDKIAFCLKYAALAPSLYNTQPWQFDLKQNFLNVYIDRRYGLPVIDPDDRGAVLAVGSALYNLIQALKNFGLYKSHDLISKDSNDSFLASIELDEEGGQKRSDETKLKSLRSFDMTRSSFQKKAVEDGKLEQLLSTAEQSGAWAYICDNAERKKIAHMTVEADRIQWMGKSFRREYALWANPSRTEDGLPDENQSFSDLMNRFSPTKHRRFLNEKDDIASDEEIYDQMPGLIMLGTTSRKRHEWLTTGMAMMALCHKAHELGLSVTMMTQACEVPDIRLRLHDDLTQMGRIHCILRVGYGGKPKFLPRKKIEDILTVSGKPYSCQPSNINALNRKIKLKNPFSGLLCWFRNLFVAKKTKTR